MGKSEYFTPTHIYFGKETEYDVGKILKNYGATKVLIHYGSNRVKTSGLLNTVKNSLKENGIFFVELGGVVANPRISLVREGIKLAKQSGVDFILAIGGGSVIDSAKAIGYGIVCDYDVWDNYVGKQKVKGSAPVGAISTMAATGSDMSNSTVITNDEGTPMKRGCSSDYCKLKFAILNPELTYSASSYSTACGITDIMMHTLERYFQPGFSLDITDELSFALLKSVMRCGKDLVDNPNSYESRASVMWSASVSHNGLMEVGNDSKGDWGCHQIAHDLSALYDVAHGAGLSAIWSSWARYVSRENENKFANLGRNVFGIIGKDNAVCNKTIDSFENFFKSIDMPVNLTTLGLNLADDDLLMIAKKITNNDSRMIGVIKKLNAMDIYEILKAAR